MPLVQSWETAFRRFWRYRHHETDYLFCGARRHYRGAASAAMITIDFEAYADATNLNGINLGGVTLTAPGGHVDIYDNRFGVSYHSETKAVAKLIGAGQDDPLIGVFDVPTSFISLWGGDGGGDTESWQLRAYDAVVGGNLLGFVDSGLWNGAPYRQLTISAPGILRFEAVHANSGFGIGYDHLQFDERGTRPRTDVDRTSCARFGRSRSFSTT